MQLLEIRIKEIVMFNIARGWTPVPVDIAKSIMIEGAELLEHFQWDESDKGIKGTVPKNWDEISLEVADVFWYLVTFCHAAKIDLAEAVKKKIEKQSIKYPVEQFNGKHNDEFYKAQKKRYRKDRE